MPECFVNTIIGLSSYPSRLRRFCLSYVLSQGNCRSLPGTWEYSVDDDDDRVNEEILGLCLLRDPRLWDQLLLEKSLHLMSGRSLVQYFKQPVFPPMCSPWFTDIDMASEMFVINWPTRLASMRLPATPAHDISRRFQRQKLTPGSDRS